MAKKNTTSYVKKSHPFRVKLTFRTSGRAPVIGKYAKATEKHVVKLYARSEAAVLDLRDKLTDTFRDLMDSEGFVCLDRVVIGEGETDVIYLKEAENFLPSDVIGWKIKASRWVEKPGTYRGGNWIEFRDEDEKSSISNYTLSQRITPVEEDEEDDDDD